jgi:hypothetical protein
MPQSFAPDGGAGRSGLANEQVSFMDGCPAEWSGLPRPPLTVGIDCGYLRQLREMGTAIRSLYGMSYLQTLCPFLQNHVEFRIMRSTAREHTAALRAKVHSA